MKKLENYSQLQQGKVYNRVYTGSNTDYGRINGKQTFVVLQTVPILQTAELFDQFGDPYTDDIRGGTVSYHSPEIAFEEYDLFEPTDEGQWFKKSIRFNSLSGALERGFIARNDVREKARPSNRSQFTPTFDGANRIKGVVCSFNVEDKTEHPFLQRVFIVWANWQEQAADFKGLGITVGN